MLGADTHAHAAAHVAVFTVGSLPMLKRLFPDGLPGASLVCDASGLPFGRGEDLCSSRGGRYIISMATRARASGSWSLDRAARLVQSLKSPVRGVSQVRMGG